jgi:putative Ca2+/H+ antiporter (TMEM165/GDT1 family)
VAEFESSSSGKKKPFASLLEVAGLIFLAEWGDRSMLATIALGAAQVGLHAAASVLNDFECRYNTDMSKPTSHL